MSFLFIFYNYIIKHFYIPPQQLNSALVVGFVQFVYDSVITVGEIYKIIYIQSHRVIVANRDNVMNCLPVFDRTMSKQTVYINSIAA